MAEADRPTCGRGGRGRRHALALAVVVAIAAVATSCMRTSADLTIHDDRTASLVLDVVPDRESWADAGTLRELDGLVRRLDADAPDGVEVERVDTDRSSGIRLTWDRVPLEELTQVVRFGETDPVELQLFRSLSVSVEDDVWRVDAVVAPVVESSTSATAGAVRELTGAEVSLRIGLPGRVTSTNADEHDRSSATWELDAGSSEPTVLFVRTEPGLGIDPVWWLVLGLAVLMVLGALLIVTADRARVRRKLRRAAEAAASSSGDRWADASATDTSGSAVAESAGRNAVVGAEPTGAGSSAPRGLYQDVTGDDSVALPVGGRSWGPAPEPGATHGEVRSVVPAPRRETAASDGAPAVGELSTGTSPSSGAGTQAGPVDTAAPVDAAPRPVPVPPGWYPDPDDPEVQRFWDGLSWTEHRR